MQGLFLWEMTVYTAAPPANAGNFPLWPHSKFCFSAWFLAFFALQVVFVFVPLARFWDFRKCFHAHKWAGACFSLYDIGQAGATSHPLSDCAPRSGRDTRTACPRWKPYSAPRREELYRILARLHNAQQERTQTAHSTPRNARKHRHTVRAGSCAHARRQIRQGSTGRRRSAAHRKPMPQQTGTPCTRFCAGTPPADTIRRARPPHPDPPQQFRRAVLSGHAAGHPAQGTL